MNAQTRLGTCAIALGALLLSACKGAEGTYKLDKAETKKSMEAELEKLPEDQKGMAKLMLGRFDSMDMSIELKPGGAAEMKASTASVGAGEAPKTDAAPGKWSKDGDTIVIFEGGKKVTCTLAGSKLTCAGSEKSSPKLVFNRG